VIAIIAIARIRIRVSLDKRSGSTSSADARGNDFARLKQACGGKRTMEFLRRKYGVNLSLTIKIQLRLVVVGASA